jgi:hypothetical protein
MGENNFDDVIKGKLAEYEDPSFDPSALAALHTRLDAQTGTFWYARYHHEILIASATTLILLFTFFIQRYFTRLRYEQLENQVHVLQQQNAKMSELLSEMKSAKYALPDTGRLINLRESNPYLYAQLVQQLQDLKSAFRDTLLPLARNHQQHVTAHSTGNPALYTGYFQRPFEWFPLNRPGAIETDSTQTDKESLRAEAKRPSRKEIIKREKYGKGVGFRLGVTADASQGYYMAGTGEINLSYGLLGDFVLSPTVSMETGVKFTHRFYSVSESELDKIELPFVNNTIGEVRLSEIDALLLEIPLIGKYRLPLTTRASLLMRLGYSSLIYTGQTFEYSYKFDQTNVLFVKDSHKKDGLRLAPGTLTFSFGSSHQLRNKKMFEGDLFYQYGIGRMGAEQNKASYVGIRGVYWIQLR